MQDVPIGGVVEVCLFAKTRIGEACGLRWRDVDPFGETLTVAQQIVDRRKHDATITYSRARKALEKLTEAAGLGASGATHRLKHTSAMISVVAGTPIPSCSARSGTGTSGPRWSTPATPTRPSPARTPGRSVGACGASPRGHRKGHVWPGPGQTRKTERMLFGK